MSTGIETTSAGENVPESDAGATDELISYVKTYSYDLAGNRTGFTLVKSGETVQDVAYTYDNLNRLSTVSEGGSVQATYTYDTNGNTLTKSTPAHGDDKASNTVYAYNSFNQLTGLNIDGTAVAYAYNAQGIRTAKRVNHARTAYLLDGGNVVAEVQSNTVTDNYLRGINLIRRTATSETEYYLFNAHGDVVTTTNPNGTINQSYDYDAFGAEKNPDTLDSNPFRYCGEHLDFETGDYYLRARYYDPSIGRFTQQDPYWNTANMIYGDTLCLSTYSYTPQIVAIIQSGNLYVYGINCPTTYADRNGCFINTITGFIVGGIIGGINAACDGGNFWTGAAVGAAAGAVSGFAVDAAVATGGIVGVAIAIIGGAVAGGTSEAVNQGLAGANFKEKETWKKIGIEAAVGAGSNLLSFGVSGGSLQKATGSFWNNMKKNAADALLEGTTKTVSRSAVKKTTKVISEKAGRAVVRKSATTVAKKVTANSAVQLTNTAVISGGASLTSSAIKSTVSSTANPAPILKSAPVVKGSPLLKVTPMLV